MKERINGVSILVKTQLDFEKIVAARIKEIDEAATVLPCPYGFKGLVLVKPGVLTKEELYRKIVEQVVEADKVIPVEAVVEADPVKICEALKDLAPGKIDKDDSFAIRTTRRGRHGFTSIDVNIVVGDCVRKYTGASVNLKYPDKVVFIEIIQNYALISIAEGKQEYHKYSPEKKSLIDLFRRIAIVQMPYLGPLDAVSEMGKRIGREVQNFEVRELVIAPTGLVDAYSLSVFINNIIEGINSRYHIQVKSYPRKPYKVPVYVMDLHQLVRDRSNEIIIVFEPEGKYIGDVQEMLTDIILKTRKRINLLFGSRKGIPPGIYRFADLVVDIAPGITLSTDYAAAAGLVALSTTIYSKYRSMISHESNNTGSR